MSNKEATLARYSPGVPPAAAEDLPVYMQSNLSSIASMVNSPTRNFPPLNKAPEKPRIGDIAYADGIAWDPGFGEGLYIYTEEGWVLVSGPSGGSGSTPVGGIIMWSGWAIPVHWTICDGSPAPNGMPTPDLIGRFVRGSYASGHGEIGGNDVTDGHVLTEYEMPSHYHGMENHTHEQQGTFSGYTGESGGHSHNVIEGRSLLHTMISYQRSTTAPTSQVIGADGATGGWRDASNHQHYVSLELSGSTSEGGQGITTSKGGNGEHSHDFEPPYYTLAYIMRYE